MALAGARLTVREKLSPEGVLRVLEIQEQLNKRRSLSFEEVVEWLIKRQYNRQRAVKRHSLSLKNVELEISPLEERGAYGLIDDE